MTIKYYQIIYYDQAKMLVNLKMVDFLSVKKNDDGFWYLVLKCVEDEYALGQNDGRIKAFKSLDKLFASIDNKLGIDISNVDIGIN